MVCKVQYIICTLRPQKEVRGFVPFISPLSCCTSSSCGFFYIHLSCPTILFTQILVLIIFISDRHFELVYSDHRGLGVNTTEDSVGRLECHHLQRPWDFLLWLLYNYSDSSYESDCWCLCAYTLVKWWAFLWYLSVCLCMQGVYERCLQTLDTNSTYQNKKKYQY
jgi:hypothetical protein